MRLVPNPEENQQIWSTLPQLDGMNVVNHLKPNAVSLLDHPTLKGQNGEPLPVIAATEAGEGRSMAILTDSTWKWGFSEKLKGANQFVPFYKNAIRWLIQDPDLELVRVEVSEEDPAPGSEIDVKTRVFDTNYEPAVGYPVELVVSRRGTPLEKQQTQAFCFKRAVKQARMGNGFRASPSRRPGFSISR